MKNISFLLPIVLWLTSCSHDTTGNLQFDTETEPLTHARLLKIERGEGFDVATVINPWDTTKILHTYVLVSDTVADNIPLPEGTVVKVPLKRAVVYSTIHIDLLDELGAHEAVKGVTDTRYINSALTKHGLENGEIIDCGSHLTPSVEIIISLNPDGILLSPYEDSGNFGALASTGIPLIECADYMEQSPLGRAEWVKFFGLLTDRYQEACDIFAHEEETYNYLKESVAEVDLKPKVLMDMMYGSTWYVPRRDATVACYIRDAGGVNPFDYLEGAGSEGLNAEQVVHRAGDSDVWLIRYSQKDPLSLKSIKRENDLYGIVKADVWGANLLDEDYFTASAFHPSLFLEEFIRVLHPEVVDSVAPRYFKPVR